MAKIKAEAAKLGADAVIPTGSAEVRKSYYVGSKPIKKQETKRTKYMAIKFK
ncbi:hypothetical protein AGMMS50222_05600 [Endomicrobiia bacterium]|nr:hypothetical protein AGMMS49531_06940 [Endomicrobiia bacterium]GHT65561.1 hypothetical protein AGMMS49556_05600 [Endomicrobiia bacterium]GHT70879.1 hypothetical protein AGMMS49950_06580 [Endomicrobiia bacterium]GHT75153.1 hypothetical protein AGMMS50222_05600 [Endomicrobiia bacterium]